MLDFEIAYTAGVSEFVLDVKIFQIREKLPSEKRRHGLDRKALASMIPSEDVASGVSLGA